MITADPVVGKCGHPPVRRGPGRGAVLPHGPSGRARPLTPSYLRMILRPAIIISGLIIQARTLPVFDGPPGVEFLGHNGFPVYAGPWFPGDRLQLLDPFLFAAQGGLFATRPGLFATGGPPRRRHPPRPVTYHGLAATYAVPRRQTTGIYGYTAIDKVLDSQPFGVSNRIQDFV
ncbi:hypothetical protein AAG570_002404 [Ranatra chinensis]|uniref:Uncharacterized protein n=1 Tax=Ranatra chinensis TaxID=642074 RepID=A0ABD0Y7F2_9HEMI